jgi:hypothetical protein
MGGRRKEEELNGRKEKEGRIKNFLVVEKTGNKSGKGQEPPPPTKK